MTVEHRESDFLIDLPMRNLLQRLDRYMLDRRFIIEVNRTGGTAEYSVVRRKRFPYRLLRRSPDFYRVRFAIREEGEGRTHITLETWHRGRWPEDVQHEIEEWIIDELGGTLSSR
jgi:hypothetical protein